MPTINREKYYNIIIKPDSYIPAAPKTSFWEQVKAGWNKLITTEPDLDPKLMELFDVICEPLKLDGRGKEVWLGHFIRHVGKSAIYTPKPILIDSLKWILQQVSPPSIAPDKMRVLSEKIIEGMANCTAGFHNRINEVALSFRKNQSLDRFLEQFRREIVERIARKHTDEVHALNRFYLKAAKVYALPAINLLDPFVGAIPDAAIETALINGFSEFYQFWGVLNSLHEQMRTGLIEATMYEGQKITGYTNGDYDEMIVFLDSYLGKSEEPFNHWLLVDDDYIVLDLNWPTIMYKLWQKLTDEGYFLYGPSEQQLFMHLFNPEIGAHILNDFLHVHAAHLSSSHLFANRTQLKAYFNDSNWLPHHKKLVFFLHYIEKMSDTITPQNFLLEAPLWRQATSLCSEAPQLMQRQLTRLLKKRDVNGNNALNLAISYQSTTIPTILELIQPLPSVDQLEIYGQVRPSKKIGLSQRNASLVQPFLEAEMSLLLMELKDKVPNYQHLENIAPDRYRALHAAVLTLHHTLVTHFNHYQQSDKNQQNVLALKINCREAIHQSKQSILGEYPDYMAMVAQILLFLTGFGTVYLLYQAQRNYSNNRSLFFPSGTENKINAVEETLNKISVASAMR